MFIPEETIKHISVSVSVLSKIPNLAGLKKVTGRNVILNYSAMRTVEMGLIVQFIDLKCKDMPHLIFLFLLIFINIWFAIRRLNKYILYAEELLCKGMQATQSVKWNEMYKWKDDMKYLGYEPELVWGHTISDQGTAIRTLDQWPPHQAHWWLRWII